MRHEERALCFTCEGEHLVGVATLPPQPGARGVVVVVGGRQYRSGSHRQFTLLARALALRGIAVMRFDLRGMGDSGGAPRDFDRTSADLRSAIDAFQRAAPAVREVVLWGLCDGATGAALYAAHDARVRGLVLLNPWVRTEDGAARATLKHYYGARLLYRAAWGRIVRGQFKLRATLGSLLALARRALRAAPRQGAEAGLPARLHGALARFEGPVLLLLAGADLTACEFEDLAATGPWPGLLADPRFTRHRLDAADHTFSRRDWRDQVAAWTADWTHAW